MHRCLTIAALAAALALQAVGCAPIQDMRGQYYLTQEQYWQGIKSFTEVARENPGSAEAQYYLGRYYLALELPEKALTHFEKAVQLDPANADYRFWTGVAHWSMADFDAEREAYEAARELDPDHYSATLYLAHNLLDSGRHADALKLYDRILRDDEYDPDALYNRAVILEELGRTDQARDAWLAYIRSYPDGSRARTAADQLNALGDYSWRNFQVGKRRVTFKAIGFTPGTADLTGDAKESLDLLAALLQSRPDLEVHVVAYNARGKALAHEQAKAVRDYVSGMYTDVDPARLHLSWFGQGETVRTAEGETTLGQSVAIFTKVESKQTL